MLKKTAMKGWVLHVCVSVIVGMLCSTNEGAAQAVRTTYAASEELFPNPDRGLYQSGLSETALSLSKLLDLRAEGLTLIDRTYYLRPYVKSDLPAAKLDSIRNDFSLLRRAGMRCVLRFAYTDNYVAPDASLAVVLRHLDQLGPLLRANTDVISVMQAGFIGVCGEWHSSANGLDTSASARQAIVEKILSVLPKNRMIQVRAIRHKQKIFGSQPLDPNSAFGGSNKARVGFHNDAFLANNDDSGTYCLNPPYWNDNDTMYAKAYLRDETRFLPLGGETNKVSTYTAKANALAECARLRWSYLNRAYHPDVVSQWVADGTLNTMKLRLGYRFSLVDAEAQTTTSAGNTLQLKLRIVNSGWASPFNAHTLQILFRNVANGSLYGATLPDDPRRWLAGDTAVVNRIMGIPPTMPSGRYELLLNIHDPDSNISARPEYSIRLANSLVWEAGTGYNSLLRTLEITPGTGTAAYKDIIEVKSLQVYNDVGEQHNERPTSFSLGQNFPNPFNPTTTITYQLPVGAFVSIRVFNLLGQLMKTVVEEIKPPGTHSVTFDSGDLASGVYLYRLESRDFVASRRCVVIK